MYSNISLEEHELTVEFINSLKNTFKGKKISLIVHDGDDTDYLLSDPNNKKELLSRIKDIEKKRNTIKIEIDD